MTPNPLAKRGPLPGALLFTTALLACFCWQVRAGAVEDNPKARPKTKLPPGLNLVADAGAGFVTIRVADIFQSDAAKEVRMQLAKAKPKFLEMFTEHFGKDFAQLERLTIIFPARVNDQPGFALTTAKPLAQGKVVQTFLRNFEEKKVHGKTCYAQKDGKGPVICLVTDRLFVIASQPHLEQLFTRNSTGDGRGPLAAILRLAADKPPVVAGLNFAAPFFQEAAKRLREEQASLRPMFAAKPGLLTVVANSQIRVELRLSFAEKDQADEAEAGLKAWLKHARTAFATGRKDMARMANRKDTDPLSRWFLQQGQDFLKKVDTGIASSSVKRQGAKEITGSMTIEANAAEAVIAVGGGLVVAMPAEKSSRPNPDKPREKR